MHAKLKESAAEVASLKAQAADATRALEEARADLEAARAAAQEAAAKAAHAEATSAEERRKRSAIEDRVAALEDALRWAQSDASSKSATHVRRIETLERKLDLARTRIAQFREEVVVAKRPAAPSGGIDPAPDATLVAAPPSDGFPEVPGLRSEGICGVSPVGTRYAARRIADRRPFEVLRLTKRLDDLETKRLAALALTRHANVASAVAAGSCNGAAYVVIERAPGETAEEWVRRSGPLPEPRAIDVARQAARGLRHAAHHGAIHGDFSPRSLRLAPSGDVHVEDAGLGAFHPDGHGPALEPRYAAPERVRGVPPDERADVYSLGAVLFHLLTGAPPFDGARAEVARLQGAGPAPDVRSLRPDVSGATAALIASFLAADRSRRPQTWDDALDALDALAAAGDDAARTARRQRVANALAAHPYLTSALSAAPLFAAALWLFTRR